MRKIIVLSFITLDGVQQAPGAPGEDTSGGFQYGGWTAPFGDEGSGEVMQKQLAPADLLLGRNTFKIFESYWPTHADIWPGVNEVTKYVLSNTVNKSDWSNVAFLTNVADIKKLKNSNGSDLKIWGSSKLVQLLLKHDLVDEFWLNIYPVILGKGKRLFDDEAMPAAFTLVESTITPAGVIMANYKKAGEVKTGTVGA
ncbi:MAG TPA: dihydrofolate reductase family protein [Mucilaginibacter sp.]|jgi:dihydrofolate reductase|nr:dihydrofolate reductase family protein [Mucilaginibacter sp.]